MVFWLFFLFLLSSCGYQFEGGGYIKDTVTQVAVLVLNNQSTETGAGLTFTNALIQEIIEKTDTKVENETSANFLLKGTVKAISFTTLSRSTTESVIERQVSATVDLQLIDKNKDVIWSVTDYRTAESYRVSDDQLTDEGNRKQAVDKIAARMAEKLVSKLVINF